MANKVTLVAALLVALVALATATTYTTTVTAAVADDEANLWQQQYCRWQLQGRQFQSCQRHIGQRTRPYEEVLEMTTEINPRQQEEHLRECCQELKKVPQRCQCEAIKHALRQVQHQEGGSEQMSEMHERVSELPRKCSLRTQRCEFGVVLV